MSLSPNTIDLFETEWIIDQYDNIYRIYVWANRVYMWGCYPGSEACISVSEMQEKILCDDLIPIYPPSDAEGHYGLKTGTG